MRQTLKQFVIALCALQLMLAPDVCLMLCCHTPTAAVAAADEADLPPCHRQANAESQTTTQSFTVSSAAITLNVPCGHAHDEKPVALQAAPSETLTVALLVAIPVHHHFAAEAMAQGQNLRVASPTVSPPFRERNLPLRI